MNDVLQDALNDIKKEKYKTMLRRYWLLAVFAVALPLGVTSAHLWVKHRDNKMIEQDGPQFMQSIRSIREGRADDAKNVLKKLSLSETGYGRLADLNLALIYAYSHQLDDASDVYSKLSQSTPKNLSIKDYSELMEITMSMAAQKLSSQEGLNRLNRYMNSGAMFTYSAKELKAALLLDLGRNEEGRVLLQELLNDNNSPDPIKFRAYRMLMIAIP